jgi:hypothetical protein
MTSKEWQAGYDAGYAAGLAAGRGTVAAAEGDAEFERDADGFELFINKQRIGVFPSISTAIDEMRKNVVPHGMATIYLDGGVADYRGGKARFKFGRTQWSRA